MFRDGDLIKTHQNDYMDYGTIRLEGEPFYISEDKKKYWMKGKFICKKALDHNKAGFICNDCANRCEERPLFVKVYEGDNEEIIQSMKNQGEIYIQSAYIGKSYGIAEDSGAICTVMEYIDGVVLNDFCNSMDKITSSNRYGLHQREKLVLKYRLMRQMLYAVRDYQNYRRERGIGIHLDLKPEHFIVVSGDSWNDFCVKLTDFEGFHNQNQELQFLVMTKKYAHPDHIKCLGQIKRGVQIRPEWDYYALGLIFYEMLEEHEFYTNEKTHQWERIEVESNKTVVIERHKSEMQNDEREELQQILMRMLSVTNPWESIDGIIRSMNGFLNKWVNLEEWKILHSEELLKREVSDVLNCPYIQVEVCFSHQDNQSIYQFYEIPQGSIISLAYNQNIPSKDRKIQKAGFFYEESEQIYYYDWKARTIQVLKPNSKYMIGQWTMHVVSIGKVGYDDCQEFDEGIEFI